MNAWLFLSLFSLTEDRIMVKIQFMGIIFLAVLSLGHGLAIGDPVPYPNAPSSGEGGKKVKAQGKVSGGKTQQTYGDEAGTGKGVVSSKNTGKAYSPSYSPTVKAEGKNIVPRL